MMFVATSGCLYFPVFYAQRLRFAATRDRPAEGVPWRVSRHCRPQGGAPRFEIKLRIANPNKQTFDIAGISYGVEIQGQELISGVTNDVPVIEAYSEEVVTLEAGLQLFHLLRLLASLGMEPTDALEYRFLGKIDFKGFVPTQRVEETGTISLK